MHNWRFFKNMSLRNGHLDVDHETLALGDDVCEVGEGVGRVAVAGGRGRPPPSPRGRC